MRSRHRWGSMVLAAALALAVASLPRCSKKRTRTVTVGMSCLSVFPASGPSVGGTDVTISGSLFQDGAMVLFGGAEANATAVSPGGKEIRCVTPPGPPGLVDVVVWNPDGIGCRLVKGFEYLLPPSPPQVASVSYADANANCLVDSGDTLTVTFTANVTFTVSDPDQAFQLPVAGDSLGAGTRLQGGTPIDAGMVIVELGVTPVLNIAGLFDPGVPLPGSPSGLDVGTTPGAIVEAVFPTVSAVPRSPPGLDIDGPRAFWTSVGDDQEEAGFGAFLDADGDVNGDGYDDLLVAATTFDTTQVDAGKVYLFPGGPSGPLPAWTWSTSGDDQARARMGVEVAHAGDVNGDGYGDVLIGAAWYDTAWENAGKAFLYVGSSAGLASTPLWTAEGPLQTWAFFGVRLSGAGDVNDDGYDDVVISAQGLHAPWPSGWGRISVYHGGPGGLSAMPDWTSAAADAMDAGLGSFLDTAGDVNGDGFADIIVSGADPLDPVWIGKAFVYHGSSMGIVSTPAWESVGEGITGASFGWSLGHAGDVNGDGYSDVIVGAGAYDSNKGKAYLYLGGPGGLSTNFAWSSMGDSVEGAGFGRRVSTAGDLDGDGYDEVIVAAPGSSGTDPKAGKVFLYEGQPGGLSSVPAWTSSGDGQLHSGFGWDLDSGDVNGDGIPEIIVGSFAHSETYDRSGKVYVYCVRP